MNLKINLKKWLLFLMLTSASYALLAEEINFECLVKINHNILPQAYQNNEKEFPRTFKYFTKTKILKNTTNGLEYSCKMSELELNCSAESGKSTHMVAINRISLRLLNEITDGGLFINERGVCEILMASDKKF